MAALARKPKVPRGVALGFTLVAALACAPEAIEHAVPDGLWAFDAWGKPAVVVSVTSNICWADYEELTP